MKEEKKQTPNKEDGAEDIGRGRRERLQTERNERKGELHGDDARRRFIVHFVARATPREAGRCDGVATVPTAMRSSFAFTDCVRV